MNDTPAAKPRRTTLGALKTVGWVAVTTIALMSGAATLMGFLARYVWVFELTCHFRVQYFFALAGCTVLFAIGRRGWRAVTCSALAAANMWLFVTLYFDRAEANNLGPRLRLVSLNVRYDNPHIERVLDFIRETRPDFVVLVEITDRWIDGLRPLTADYPYSRHSPRPDASGIALFSKYPLASVHVLDVGVGPPSILATVDIQGQHLAMIGTHPMSPMSPEHLGYRNEEFKALTGLINSLSRPLLLAGDLNATTWSPYVEDLVFDTNLSDSRQGFGVQPTWPVAMWLLRVPIDHCFVSPEIIVLDRWVGPNVGSDHFPIVVDFGLQQPSGADRRTLPAGSGRQKL